VVLRGLLRGLLEGRRQGGERLTEAEACGWFRVSRTPVREALLELQGLGFVELRRNCGAVFLPFGPTELGELYEVRALLETEATRRACGRIAPQRLEFLEEGLRRIEAEGGVDPGWKWDRELHGTIAAAAGNRRLAAEIGRYGDLVQAVREIVGADGPEIHQATAREHLAILSALRSGSAPDAEEAMRRHLIQAGASAVAAVERLRRERGRDGTEERPSD
jgi:DNA-binding GntR family transcriptional regulator